MLKFTNKSIVYENCAFIIFYEWKERKKTLQKLAHAVKCGEECEREKRAPMEVQKGREMMFEVINK
jgi:hypothetical protein